MTVQPKNQEKTEQKTSKDELSEKEVEKVTGGAVSMSDIVITKPIDKSSSKLS
jgi:type VI protein secretion system component Hcp